jgi:hypothetical protein
MLRLRFFQRLGLLGPMLRLHDSIDTWAQSAPVPAGAAPSHRVRAAGRAD